MTENNVDQTSAKIIVKTSGLWRSTQLIDALSSLDSLITRIAVATRISSWCQQYDYVMSNLRALGLLNKGNPENWDEAKTPTDYLARTDYVDFISHMRNAGVDIQQSTLGFKFKFQVSDLLDLVPTSNRLEIEKIQMASPGEWILGFVGVLCTRPVFSFLEKIFDAVLYNKSIKMKKDAEALEAMGKARLAHVKVNEQKALSENVLIKDQTTIVLDYSVALDSLTGSLRNAGFDNSDITNLLHDKVMQDIDKLARYKSIGLISSVSITETK